MNSSNSNGASIVGISDFTQALYRNQVSTNEAVAKSNADETPDLLEPLDFDVFCSSNTNEKEEIRDALEPLDFRIDWSQELRLTCAHLLPQLQCTLKSISSGSGS